MSGRNDGFTIVETLIVLAVAGLILLIVFMAIPSLERNSRNNQRRQDVQTILQAVSHYELNDSGNFPVNCGPAPACTSVKAGAPNDYFLRFLANKLSFYTTANQVMLSSTHSEGDSDTSVDKVYIHNYERCNPSGGTATIKAAGYSDVVALYSIEAGNSGTQPECEQL